VITSITRWKVVYNVLWELLRYASSILVHLLVVGSSSREFYKFAPE